MIDAGEHMTSGGNGKNDDGQPSLIDGGPSGQQSSSLKQSVGLLSVFSEEMQLLGISGLAELTGLSRTTTHRYANTLVQRDYLEQGSARKYRLAPPAVDPGAEIIREILHMLQVRTVLKDLSDQFGHTQLGSARQNARPLCTPLLWPSTLSAPDRPRTAHGHTHPRVLYGTWKGDTREPSRDRAPQTVAEWVIN